MGEMRIAEAYLQGATMSHDLESTLENVIFGELLVDPDEAGRVGARCDFCQQLMQYCVHTVHW